MDKQEMKKLRKEYLEKNSIALEWVLNDLDNIVRLRISKGYSKIYITDIDIKGCVLRYNQKVAIGSSRPMLPDDVSTQGIMSTYELRLQNNGIMAITRSIINETDCNLSLCEAMACDPAELNKNYLVIIFNE